MGLFDRFKRQPEEKPHGRAQEPQADWPSALAEIASVISGGDGAVLEEVSACASDPAGYYAAHRERYEERSVDDTSALESIQWLGLVDILEAHSCVCERDWKDEKEDFLYFLENLNGMKRLGLELQEDWLSEEDDISIWSRTIDEKWKPKQCCVGCIGIDSDSYVLFPCKLAELERLKTLAARLGRSIERAGGV